MQGLVGRFAARDEVVAARRRLPQSVLGLPRPLRQRQRRVRGLLQAIHRLLDRVQRLHQGDETSPCPALGADPERLIELRRNPAEFNRVNQENPFRNILLP